MKRLIINDHTESRKEPLYFQAGPRKKILRKQRSTPFDSQIIDKTKLKEGKPFRHIIKSSKSLEMTQRRKNEHNDIKQIPSFVSRKHIIYNDDDDDDNPLMHGVINKKRHNRYKKKRCEHRVNEKDKISLLKDKGIDEKRKYKIDVNKFSIQVDDLNDNVDNDYKIRDCPHLLPPKLVNDTTDGTDRTHISILVDTDGNVQQQDNQCSSDELSDDDGTILRRGTMEYDNREEIEKQQRERENKFIRSKTLPIMINGQNGQKILLQGIKTVVNGQEVILINNNTNKERKIKRQKIPHLPISPVQPDLDYNNNFVSVL